MVCASVSRAAGGIFPIMQAHAQELMKLGIQVTAYGLEDAYAYADSVSWAPAELKICRPTISRFAYSPDLGKSIENADHDILHQHGLWLYPSIVVSRWRRQRGRPV